jgi:glutamate formiminotransferase/formiminotetrahydrofolate cyclodeaminase
VPEPAAASGALVECVPNVSEGRDPDVIAALAAAITGASGVRLLHVDVGADAHRTVFTFVGEPEPVGDAAVALAAAVARLVDMRRHHGAHPRLGALDVCPFVPVGDVSMTRCVGVARRVASTIAHDHDAPVFLYEAAAWDRRRAALPTLRRGEYEGLPERLADPTLRPDFGPARRHPALGAVIVGARPFLIAWNLALDTTDVAVARAIAARVRASGVMAQEQGTRHRRPGRLPAVRAVGWGMPSYGHAQVSLNVLDYTVTPLHVAWQVVGEEALALGARVVGSELIGLVPLDALRAAGRAALASTGGGESDDAGLVAAAVRLLGLDAVHPFVPRERVLEWAIAAAG